MSATTVKTPKFRINWPSLLKPRLNKLSGKENFEVTALFAKGENLTTLNAAIEAACAKKWGPEKAKWPKNLRLPIKPQGDEKREVDGKMVLRAGYEPGAFFAKFTAQADRPPVVVDRYVKPLTDETQIFSGGYAYAEVNAGAYDQAGNRGVSLYLSKIQITGQGDPIDGRTKVEDTFEPIEQSDNDFI